MPEATGLSEAYGPREALWASIAPMVAEILKTLRSPQMRGPFPYPSSDDLGRAAYLRELARWGRAAALRSRESLGARGVDKALEAAARLEIAAELLATIEAPPAASAPLGSAG